MKTVIAMFATTLIGGATLIAPNIAAEETLTAPFGAGDMAGASNLMTSDKALEAVALMKSGTVLSLSLIHI